MITFLFWNIRGQPLTDRVSRIVVGHGVDVVLLAESENTPGSIATALSRTGIGLFRFVPGTQGRLQTFTRHPLSGWSWIFGEVLGAWQAYRFEPPGCPKLLLFVAHLPSKLHADEMDQASDAAELAADIRLQEQAAGHTRTILVGDLNMNPFEKGVAWSRGLHGVSTRMVARRDTREIRGRELPLFYNPMWGGLGDRTPGHPPGTYYRSSSQTVNYFWNTYDQVLLRPKLMDQLTEVRVLETDGTTSLLTANGLPDKVNGSDHLPLLFRLECKSK